MNYTYTHRPYYTEIVDEVVGSTGKGARRGEMGMSYKKYIARKDS